MSSRIKPFSALLRSNATVWSVDDLRILWMVKNEKDLKDKIRYYTKTNQMQRLHRGIYVLDDQYNRFELAQKLIRPSYISLETALRKHGVLHQYAEGMSCIASYPRTYTIDEREYRYHQMDGSFLSYPVGIKDYGTYMMASPERAICDALYFGFQFDVEQKQDWNKELLKKIEYEFAQPRVTRGLIKYSLLS